MKRLLQVSFFCMAVLIPLSSWAAFDLDVGETAKITLAFDIEGSAYITPFYCNSKGAMFSQDPILLTDVSGYKFPTFIINNPPCGIYNCGAFVHAVEDSVVSINTLLSSFSNSAGTIVLRPANPSCYRVAPLEDEFVQLQIFTTYPFFIPRSNP